MTSPFDASYGNTSRTTVDELLATSVENSHKSNGDVQVITAATENTAAVARHLIKPHRKTGNFWAFYMLYDLQYHPNHRENAHCTLCFADISIKGCTTSGLKRHLQSRHCEQFESINDTASTSSETTGQRSISHLFPKAKNMNDIQTEYVHAVTNFIIAESQPFTIVASPEFQGLFCPFHKEANKITEASLHRVRE
jgi:hypothetical protein